MTDGGDTDIADILIPFCEAASISITKDLAAILKKRIIVSLCFANTRPLHDALFPEQHMDWNGVTQYLLLESCQDWLCLLAVLDFVDEQPSRQLVAELIASTLAGIKVSTHGKTLSPIESLQLCFAKAGIAPSWDVLCKTLILANLAEIDHAVAIQHFLQPHSSQSAIDVISRALSSCKHTPEEYTQCFLFLFSNCCQVRTHILHQAFEARQQRRERLKKHAQSIYHAHKKPSLTQILETRTPTTPVVADSFVSFCNATRMASNSSMLVKRAIYYVFVTQTAMDNRLIGNDALVLDAIARIPPIVTPDTQALKAFINEIHHTGPPCQALRLFKDKCIPGSVNWSVVLRLYLAAFGGPVAKELWRATVAGAGGGLCSSTETEMATQRFVAQTPFDMDAMINLILTEDPAASPSQ